MSVRQVLHFITNHPLNRNQQLRALLRFAGWQIRSRLQPGPVISDWIGGVRFYVQRHEYALTGNIYTGLYEFHEMAFLLHILRPDDLYIDVGANVGSYTLLACGVSGARGVAFEPIPATFERMLANIQLNGLQEKVDCHNLGVGREEGVLLFTSDQNTTNHALAAGETSDGAAEVRVVNLDSILQGMDPFLLKIDVEGFETPVLEGGLKVLANPALKAVIMELNGSGDRYGFDEESILAKMLALGFQTYGYDPFSRRLIPLEGKNADAGNTLFIRDKKLVAERLRTAAPIAVHGRQL